MENDYYSGINEAARNLAEDLVNEKMKEKNEEIEKEKEKMENAIKEAENVKKVYSKEKEKMENAIKEAENENLKKFLNSYKNFNYSLEDYEKISNINFAELDMNKIITYWGKEIKYENKLKALKEFIGKKRKNNSNINPK